MTEIFAKKNIIRLIALVMSAAFVFSFSGCKNEEYDKTESEVSESEGDYKITDIPEFVPAKERFTDTDKQYVLPNGYLYEYSNLLSPDFENYADTKSEDWVADSRIRSTGEAGKEEGSFISNYIPCKAGDIIRICGADAIFSYSGSGSVNWCYYDSDKKIIGVFSPYMDDSGRIVWNENGEIEQAEAGYISGEIRPETAYVRFTLSIVEKCDIDEVAISINEEITYTESDESGWSRKELYVPSDWYDEINDKSLRIKELDKGGETIKFLVTTDIHIDPVKGKKDHVENMGKVSAQVMKKCDIPFFMNLGDTVTQATNFELDVFEVSVQRFLDTLYPIPEKNILATVGNHDGAIGVQETDADPLYYRYQLNNEQRSSVFFDWQREASPEKKFGEDGTYYYIDDEITKTRYIMLNSFWSDWKGDEKTGLVENKYYSFFHCPIYGQEQLSWFAHEALDMPKGYSAIIGTHHASDPNDYEMLRNIIEAYVDRKSYSGSYAGECEWWSSSIEVDYSSAKGEIIAIFQGHNHRDAVDTETFAVPCITVTTAGAYYAVKDENPPERVYGTSTETAIDAVVIDKEERVINIIRIGAGRDRRIEY